MGRVSWDDATARHYETGVDRGVLYPKASPAVPWHGLTAVDEVGAEGTSTYYIDGRPFLNLPRLKEFQATIKAYTYPDELNDLVGMPETADGMYVDSQMGDSFDLSYRTLIGDGASGTRRGYKLHLVYNATVAPQGSSYETLKEEINPMDFSWEITTVPVPIQGYHASAHIVIDSRKVDDEKMLELENLLYGSATSDVTELPRPEIIFNLLNFGDTVVITDNGDGTWTATGSNADVLVDSNGNFTLKNVDAILYGDGQYYFGDIPPLIEPEAGTIDGGYPGYSTPEVIDGGTPGDPGTDILDGGGVSSSGGINDIIDEPLTE